MFRRYSFPILAIGLSTLVTQAQAAPPVVVRIESTTKPIPAHIYVAKGATVRFEGPIKSGNRDVSIMLKVGSDLRVSGSFSNDWRLEWDPAKERFTHNTVTLSFAAPNGDEVRFARIVVDTLDKVPFKIAAQGTTENIEGNLAFKIEPTGDMQADHYDLFLDDKPLNVTLNASGQGSLDLSDGKPGPHKLIAQVVTPDGGTLSIDPFDISIAAKLHLAPLSRQEGVFTVDLRDGKTAPTLLLQAIIDDAKVEPQSVVYSLDERPIGHGSIEQAVTLNPQKLLAGEHHLAAEVTTVDGKHFLSADLPFIVTRDLHSEMIAWREHLQQDTEAYDALLTSALRTLGTRFGLPGFPRVGLPSVSLSTAVPIWTQLKAESRDMARKSRGYPLPGVAGAQRETLHQAMLYYAAYYDNYEEAARAFLDYMRILERYNGSPSGIGANPSELTRVREAYSKYTAKQLEANNQLDKAEAAVTNVLQANGTRKL